MNCCQILLLFSIAAAGNAMAQTPTNQTVPANQDESVSSAPDQASAPNQVGGLSYESASRITHGDYDVTYGNEKDDIQGFSFTNHGPNSVVTIATRGIGMGPQRDFELAFPARARQDIKMTIADVPTQFLSQRMESYFYFFPRKVLPSIQWPKDGTSVFTVTLPTGESVQFNTVSKEMVGGVLKETAPIDLGPDRFKRKFAAIEYTGTGVYLRVDKRGADPRLGTTAVIHQGTKTCKVPSSKLFDQREDSAVLFQFPTDEAFNEFLKKTCQMSFL